MTFGVDGLVGTEDDRLPGGTAYTVEVPSGDLIWTTIRHYFANRVP